MSDEKAKDPERSEQLQFSPLSIWSWRCWVHSILSIRMFNLKENSWLHILQKDGKRLCGSLIHTLLSTLRSLSSALSFKILNLVIFSFFFILLCWQCADILVNEAVHNNRKLLKWAFVVWLFFFPLTSWN